MNSTCHAWLTQQGYEIAIASTCCINQTRKPYYTCRLDPHINMIDQFRLSHADLSSSLPLLLFFSASAKYALTLTYFTVFYPFAPLGNWVARCFKCFYFERLLPVRMLILINKKINI